MKVVVAGGRGALGRRLVADLAGRGHEVVVLTRSPRAGLPSQLGWDGVTVGGWRSALAGAVVVNLAGELVDRRPTPANVALLTRSRVEPTRALGSAATGLDPAVPVWVQASTLAIHGDAGEALLDDTAPPAAGPPQMAGVATAWEAAAADVPAGRTVVLRTSIVLDRDTPALDRLRGLVRAGVGGRVGSGRQWFSWIHVEDWLRVVRWCSGLSDPAEPGLPDADVPLPSGVLAVTAPEPVRNAELMATLRRVLRRPPAPPIPAFAVRLGSIPLRTDPALGLTGRRVVPSRLLEAGFTFRYPHLEPALRDLLSRG